MTGEALDVLGVRVIDAGGRRGQDFPVHTPFSGGSMDLEQRLARLERSNRRWQFGFVAVLAVGLAGVMMAADEKPVPGDLKVKSLQVVDADGKPAVVLIPGKAGASGALHLLNAKGDRILSAGCGADENSLLELRRPGGKAAITLTAHQLSSTLQLNRDDGANTAMIYSEDGEGRLSLYRGKTAVWDAITPKK